MSTQNVNEKITLADLADVPIWVAWKEVPDRETAGKPKKVPYNPHTAKPAKANDHATWGTRSKAEEAAKSLLSTPFGGRTVGGGVGIEFAMLDDDTSLGGIDLDICRDESEKLTDWATRTIDLFGSYTEVSPSKTGAKIFFRYRTADFDAIRAAIGITNGKNGKKWSSNTGGEHPPAIELYLKDRYFTVTNKRLGEAESLAVAPVDWFKALAELASKAFPKDRAGTSGANRDQSRSAAAFREVLALRRRNPNLGRDELEEALRDYGDPSIVAWLDEKGDTRQLDRIWEKTEVEWGDPVDFFDNKTAGSPELKPEHLPPALGPFVFDSAERMGTDPAAVALAALVSLATIVSDDWQIQVKRYDDSWVESARLWGLILGDPSILKSPIIRLVTGAIDMLEEKGRKDHGQEMAEWQLTHKIWKDAKTKDAKTPAMDEPVRPRLVRYLVENITVEALGEVLRNDREATMTAPAKKVLIRQDELSEFLSGFDRYTTGKGGSDRGAFLRGYNGGRHTIDRIGRGSFAIPNWSFNILGGIQPGPIQRVARDTAEDGMLQRFCYVVASVQQRGVDRKQDKKALDKFHNLFVNLSRMPMNFNGPRSVTLSDESHVVREEFFNLAKTMQELPDTSPRLRAALGKYAGIWARMVLIFHLIGLANANVRDTTAGVVPDDIVLRATRFMHDIMLPHLIRADALMFETIQTGHARWIAGHILAHELERITARDITRVYRALQAPEQRRAMLEVMASLEAMAWVRAEITEGRDARSWLVNPLVHNFTKRAKAERAQRADEVARLREVLSKRKVAQS